ncbi:MAG TPA: TonB-dependent receptor [Acidobacteriaceae bacterium]|nr:TonB-dependent receptor [Acidobacteriaceae bacterium]
MPSLLLAACLLLTAPAFCRQTHPAAGQNQLKTLSLQQLGNIEVTTVSKEPEAVWKTAAAIYVITQDDIRRSGATNIPEALRLAPGVEVARITSDEYAIGIRGFNSRLSRYVLVLIDGRTVYTPLTAGTYWETQDTFIQDVDRIEVIRGPGGTIWGPNAVNGVINIITKNAKDTRGVLAAGAGGNVEQVFGDTRYGSGNGQGFNYRVYVKGFGWAPEYHADGDNYDDWHSGQGGFRMDWDRHHRDTYRLQGDVYGQDFGERASASSYSPPANYDLSGDASLYGGNILWSWRRVQSDDRDFELAAYYDHATRDELNFGDIRNTVDVDFNDRFPLSRQEISWGGTVRASHGNETQIFSGLTFTPPQRTDQLYQGFIQDEISVVPNRLAFIAGTKVLKTNYTGVLGEPSGRLLYTPTSTQTLWAAYTHALRTPADVERDFNLSSFLEYADGLPVFARFSANPHFRSEQMNGYELGYRTLVGSKLYLDVASFYNHYGDAFSEDLVGPFAVETNPAPTHLLLPAQFGNGLVASTTGGEVAPDWRPLPWWRLSGSYTFLEMHVKKGTNSKDIGSAPTVQGSSPEHQALIRTDFDLPKSVSTDLQIRYASALPGIHVASYWTGNATVEWGLSHHVRFTASGRNLLQPHHVEFSYDPGPPVGIRRSIYGQITFTK